MNSILFQMEKPKNMEKKTDFLIFSALSASFKRIPPEIRVNPEASENKIRLDRILRKNFPESRCDLQRGFPVRRFPPGQSQLPGDPVKMGVQRNDQMRRRNPSPAPRIHRILPHQPPEHQIQALARTSPFRRWKKGRFPSRKTGAQLRTEPLLRPKDRRIPLPVESRRKTRFQRSMPVQRDPDPFQKIRQILPRMKPMLESPKIPAETLRIPRTDIIRRAIPQNPKHLLQTLQNLQNPSIRQRRGRQRCNFPVLHSPERNNHLQRIR